MSNFKDCAAKRIVTLPFLIFPLGGVVGGPILNTFHVCALPRFSQGGFFFELYARQFKIVWYLSD
jgi:hypothetical protein